ncbi:MAG: hypothetical protein HY556_09530 [Euryarchaeota archaeon]|nr:hypothetical protein [Euryarchaeota archaeon]
MAFPLPPLDAGSVLYLLAGAGMLFTALVLLYFDFRSRVNQTFALFLTVRGIGNALNPWFLIPETTDLAGRLQPYFWIAVPFATALFYLAFRARYAGRPAGRMLPVLIVVTALVAEGLYASDHSLFAASTSTALVPGDPGPLFVLFFLVPTSYAAVAALLSRELRGGKPGPRSQSLLIVAAGFALDAAFLVGFIPTGYLLTLFDPTVQALLDLPAATSPIGIAGLVTIVLTAVFLAIAWRNVGSNPEATSRAAVSRYGVAMTAALASGIFTSAVLALRFDPAGFWVGGVDAFWTLALPVLVGYALLKHQLFDIDVRAKWTIKRGTLAAMFLAVFFVVAQLAQNFLSDEYGLVVGGVAAGLMLFALSPLQRVAEDVANAAMPGVKSFNEMSHPERLAAYLRSAKIAWADGAIDRSERAMLDGLRETLGLSTDEATRLESEASRA